MHPKCPNCNYNLIEIKKEQKSDVMIIQIKKKQSHRNSSVTSRNDLTVKIIQHLLPDAEPLFVYRGVSLTMVEEE